MQVRCNGAAVQLTQSNFVAAGGEGKVWVINGIAYKVYDDPQKMIAPGKIQDLSAINDRLVVRPLEVLTSRNNPVGYSMTAVTGAIPLQQTLTKAHRERTGLTIDRILKRVAGMRQTVANVHAAGILIVDMNELNELVAEATDEVFFIDTDSWQTARFPATAIMESIRDRHMSGPRDFTEGSDWFSFGVLAHQMMRGIHPYKGRLPGFDHRDLDGRMQANASVYTTGCRLNRAVYPESMVPATYLDWFKAVFNDGKRVPPPVDFVTPAQAVASVAVVKVGTGFIFTSVVKGHGRVRSYVSLGRGNSFAVTETGTFNVSNVATKLPKVTGDISIFLNKNGKPCYYTGSAVHDLATGRSFVGGLVCDAHMAHEGKLYLKIGACLNHVTVDGIHTGGRVVGNVMESATTLYPGCSVSSAMGRWLINTLPPTGGTYQHNLKELIGWRILDAGYSKGILVVYATEIKTGANARFVYKEQHAVAKLFKKTDDPDTMDCNFIVLDNGVCILAEGDGIEIFSLSGSVIQQTDHQTVNGGVRLVTHDGMAAFISGEEVIAFRKG